jgi:hypothetical protein
MHEFHGLLETIHWLLIKPKFLYCFDASDLPEVEQQSTEN